MPIGVADAMAVSFTQDSCLSVNPDACGGTGGGYPGDGAGYPPALVGGDHCFDLQSCPAIPLPTTPVTGERAACIAACNQQEEMDHQLCRAQINPTLRALCWERATVNAGNCRVGCERLPM